MNPIEEAIYEMRTAYLYGYPWWKNRVASNPWFWDVMGTHFETYDGRYDGL